MYTSTTNPKENIKFTFCAFTNSRLAHLLKTPR